MIEVYSSLSAAEVNVRRAMLEEAGIPTFLRNEALSTLTNAFAAPFQPALCVVRDEDFDGAMTLIRSIGVPEFRSDWTCPHCGESVPATFESCWKCETNRPEASV